MGILLRWKHNDNMLRSSKCRVPVFAGETFEDVIQRVQEGVYGSNGVGKNFRASSLITSKTILRKQSKPTNRHGRPNGQWSQWSMVSGFGNYLTGKPGNVRYQVTFTVDEAAAVHPKKEDRVFTVYDYDEEAVRQ